MLKHYFYIAVVVSFGIQFLFGDFYVLQEYGSLFKHYHQHEACYGDSFYTFVDKHYGKERDKHSREHHDENHKIPFSGQSFESHHFVPVAFPVFSFAGEVSYTHKNKVEFYKNHCHKWLLNTGILQPPKITLFNT